jgi:GNAT superfamily N-acetyltransferase
MTAVFRNFTSQPGFTEDFHRVREFLVRINALNPIHYDFEWGRWEWGFSLPYLDTTNLSKIGVWEDNDKIVAAVTYEQGLGDAYFCLDPQYAFLKTDILLHAKNILCTIEGKIKVLINNADREFQRIAGQHGFKPTQNSEATAVMDINPQHIAYTLPQGYSITSMADSYDLIRFNRVLWRGFNHEGEPLTTEKQLEERRISLSGPHLNHNLCIAVVAPNGEFASYCGMWYDARTEYALVEPVATDPTYRKLGLGKAAVLEAVKRCGQLGAKQAYVGSSQQFYYQLGFHPLPGGTFWEIC